MTTRISSSNDEAGHGVARSWVCYVVSLKMEIGMSRTKAFMQKSTKKMEAKTFNAIFLDCITAFIPVFLHLSE